MTSWEDVTLTFTYDPEVRLWRLDATGGDFGFADYLESLLAEDVWDAICTARGAFARLDRREGGE